MSRSIFDAAREASRKVANNGYEPAFEALAREVWSLARMELRDELQKEQPVEAALDLIRRYGGTDGDHHKSWVIDQVTRALTGARYDQFVKDARDGEDGPETYGWDIGVPP